MGVNTHLLGNGEMNEWMAEMYCLSNTFIQAIVKVGASEAGPEKPAMYTLEMFLGG